MPTHTPKLLGNVEKLLQEKLQLALDNRGREVNVLVNIGQVEAKRTLHKLRAMRAGLKQYQPEGSELQTLAKNKFIRFYQDYKRSNGPGREYTVWMRIYATEDIRPSAAVAKSLEDFYAGRRSTPF